MGNGSAKARPVHPVDEGGPSKAETRAVLREYQTDIEDAIRRAIREEAVREKLKLIGAPKAKERVEAQAELPWLERSIDVPTGKYRDEQKFARARRMQESVSVAMAKRKEAQQRKNAAPEFVGPTPERMAKEDPDEGVRKLAPPITDPTTRTNTRAYQMQAPLDRFEKILSPEQVQAGRYLRDLFLAAEVGQRVTGSYGDGGGSVPGPRHGGVLDFARQAACTVEKVRKDWPEGLVKGIEWFITQQVIHQDGSPMRFEEMGATIIPWKSQDGQKASGYTRFIDVLDMAVKYFRNDLWMTPQLQADALSAARAGAQIKRERLAKMSNREQERLQSMQGGGS